MKYVIKRAISTPELQADWDSPAWRDVMPLAIDRFHPQSSNHRPITHAKLLFTDDALHVLFRVQDRYVRSIRTQFQEMVCRDSCVEIFLEPTPGKGYFNFEFNCGGAMMVYFVEDPTRTEEGFKKYLPLPSEACDLVRVVTTMPTTTPIEITDPIEWRLEAKIPFNLMARHVNAVSRGVWHGNLYKCASDISKPHWASWRDVGQELNFHQPDRFGELVFEHRNAG